MMTNSRPAQKPSPIARITGLIDAGVSFFLCAMIQLYRVLLSPWLGPHCRFQPTCSAYAMESIKTHRPWRGGYLALRRIAKCHPISFLGAGSGFDPVPPADLRSPTGRSPKGKMDV